VIVQYNMEVLYACRYIVKSFHSRPLAKNY